MCANLLLISAMASQARLLCRCRRRRLPVLRGPYRVPTGGGCRRERQGERSRHNARVEQALCAAGFGGEAKREASAKKPRALEVARGSAPVLSPRRRRSRAKGEEGNAPQPNYRAAP
jgi:hypothetical protein